MSIKVNEIIEELNRQFLLTVLGQALISTILCVLPFLEQDQLESLPSLVASSIVHLPASIHGYIVNVLCYFLLPLIIDNNDSNQYK